MFYKNWQTEHKDSLKRLVNVGFDEIITSNTLDYFLYIRNIERGNNQMLRIAEDLKQFSEEERKMYYDIQKRLTILDLTQTLGKAIVYLENFEDKLPEKFDITDAFIDPVKGKKIAPYETIRSNHFRDFKIRRSADDRVD
jgi:hypothetical protein